MRKPYQVRPVPPLSGKQYQQYPKPGFCTHCGQLATQEALFDGDGIIVVEKYCDACMEPKLFEMLQTIYSRQG